MDEIQTGEIKFLFHFCKEKCRQDQRHVWFTKKKDVTIKLDGVERQKFMKIKKILQSEGVIFIDQKSIINGGIGLILFETSFSKV